MKTEMTKHEKKVTKNIKQNLNKSKDMWTHINKLRKKVQRNSSYITKEENCQQNDSCHGQRYLDKNLPKHRNNMKEEWNSEKKHVKPPGTIRDPIILHHEQRKYKLPKNTRKTPVYGYNNKYKQRN